MLNVNIGDKIICRDGTIYTACTKGYVPYGGLDNPHVRKYTFVGIRVQDGITSWNGWYKDGSAILTGEDGLDIEQVIPKEKPMQQTKQPRKHAELIKAWADGAEIQFKTGGDWLSFEEIEVPSWLDNFEYRIKPEVKPDVVKYYKATTGVTVNQYNPTKYSNLKLTFDANTGKLKTAEVIETE